MALPLITLYGFHFSDFITYFFLLNLNVLNAMPMLGSAYDIAI